MDSTTIINQQDQPEERGPATVKKGRNAAVNTLAIVGFLALIFIGIALAIYSSQFVPTAVNRLSSTGTANNGFTSAQNSIAPSNTTIPYGTSPATTTVMIPSSIQGGPATTPIPSSAVPQTTTAYPSTSGSSYGTSSNYPATTGSGYSTPPSSGYAPTAPALYGLPDLSTNIVTTGYLSDGPGSPFVASPVVPVGAVAAIQFTIANVGTNATGPWNFIAQIPTDNGYTYTSPTEENMNPGDHILFTLSFDQVPPGQNELIRVIADPNNYLQEVTKSNNVANATITVVGS